MLNVDFQMPLLRHLNMLLPNMIFLIQFFNLYVFFLIHHIMLKGFDHIMLFYVDKLLII